MPYDKNKKPEKAKLRKEQEERLKKRVLSAHKNLLTDAQYLSNLRAEYKDLFDGAPLGNEIDGRSQVVMTDVSNVIETAMPDLIKAFLGKKDVVTISPVGPEDEMKAKNMSIKVNHDFSVKNPGFKILYTFIKDALINKYGVIKYYWERGEKITYKEYGDLTEEQMMRILSDPSYEVDKIEIKESDEYTVNQFGEIEFQDLYDISAKKIDEYSCPKIENIPPDEFLFDITKTMMDDDGIVCHKKLIRSYELERYGLDEEEVSEQVEYFSNTEVLKRFEDIGGYTYFAPDNLGDYYYLYEYYLYDHDKKRDIPMKVTIFGNKVISMEINKYGRPPFVVGSPFLEPHRMVGRGFAEKLKDNQYMNTAVTRSWLDNLYFQNDGQFIVNPFRVDIEEVEEARRPGGIIQTLYDVDPQTAIVPRPYAPFPPQALKFMDTVLPEIREERIGITRYTQGMDSRTLNDTATGISIITSASLKRLELITRIFGETAIKELFQGLVDMNINFFNRKESIKIEEGFVELGPDEIDGRFDLSVEIIGAETKEMVYQQISNMLNSYAMAAKLMGPEMFVREIANFRHLREAYREMWRVSGFKNTDRFVYGEEKDRQEVSMQQPQQMAGMGVMGDGRV